MTAAKRREADLRAYEKLADEVRERMYRMVAIDPYVSLGQLDAMVEANRRAVLRAEVRAENRRRRAKVAR